MPFLNVDKLSGRVLFASDHAIYYLGVSTCSLLAAQVLCVSTSPSGKVWGLGDAGHDERGVTDLSRRF